MSRLTLRIGQTDNSRFSACSGKWSPIRLPIRFASQCHAVEYRLGDQPGAILIPARPEGGGKLRQSNVSPGGFCTFSRLIPDFTPELQEQTLSKRAAGIPYAITDRTGVARFQSCRFVCTPGVAQRFILGFSSLEFRKDRPLHRQVVTACYRQGTTPCF